MSWNTHYSMCIFYSFSYTHTLSGLIRLMEISDSSDARSINKSVYSVPLYHYAAMTPSSWSDQYTSGTRSGSAININARISENLSISENKPQNVLTQTIIMENDITRSLWDLTDKLLRQLKAVTYTMLTSDLCSRLCHFITHQTDPPFLLLIPIDL